MYYIFNPIWKDNTRPNRRAWFVGDNSICYTKFRSIQDGVENARLDGTALREMNWEVWECSLWHQKRIMLKTLWILGYLNPIYVDDDISRIYYAPVAQLDGAAVS